MPVFASLLLALYVRTRSFYIYTHKSITTGMYVCPVVVMASYLSGRRTRTETQCSGGTAGVHAMPCQAAGCKDDDDNDGRVTSFFLYDVR